MAAFLDVCRFTPTAGGTTDWTVSAAVAGYQTPAAAGAVNARVYRYRAESADLTQWEIGYGAYTVSGTVLARTTVLYNSSGNTSKINFTLTPQVAVVALKEDILAVEEANSFTLTQQNQARQNLALHQTFFSASQSASSASQTSGVITKIQCNTEEVDALNWYDNATNYRFLPTVAGWYEVTGVVCGFSTVSITEVDSEIRLNGSTYSRNLNLAAGVATTSMITEIIQFNGSTDYAELWGIVIGTGTLTFVGGTAPRRTWFHAKLIG